MKKHEKHMSKFSTPTMKECEWWILKIKHEQLVESA